MQKLRDTYEEHVYANRQNWGDVLYYRKHYKDGELIETVYNEEQVFVIHEPKLLSFERKFLSIYNTINKKLCSSKFPSPKIEFYKDTEFLARVVNQQHLRVDVELVYYSDEDLWLIIMHEMGHNLVPGGGHGPEFTSALKSRGVSFSKSNGDNGIVTYDHAFIPGGRLEQVRRDFEENQVVANKLGGGD